MDYKYLHLEHEDGYFCGPFKTFLAVILFASLIAVPTYIIADYKAYNKGVENGIARVEHAMHMAVLEGLPLAFVDGDVRMVYTVKFDSKEFRGNVKNMADRYELIKYRITEEFGPEESHF
jgi:hypothetical protein